GASAPRSFWISPNCIAMAVSLVWLPRDAQPVLARLGGGLLFPHLRGAHRGRGGVCPRGDRGPASRPRRLLRGRGDRRGLGREGLPTPLLPRTGASRLPGGRVEHLVRPRVPQGQVRHRDG